MKTRKTKIITIVSIVLGLFAVSAMAIGCNHAHRKMTPEQAKKMASRGVENVLDEVDATEAQIAVFESAAYNIIDDVFAMKKDHKQKHKQLHKELVKEAPDKEKLLVAVDEHIEEIRDVAHNSVETMLEAWNTLSVEQKRQLLAKLEKHHEKFEH